MIARFHDDAGLWKATRVDMPFGDAAVVIGCDEHAAEHLDTLAVSRIDDARFSLHVRMVAR